MSSTTPVPPQGSFAPLRQMTFAVIWIATILGNTGSFMRDVASSWLVTDLGGGPAAVAMIQAAGTLPVFLLAIPAGVLSDILDRRRFLLVVQLCLAVLSGTLMVLSHQGLLTIQILVTVTFLGGVCAALVGPTWQSIVPELVPPSDLKNAVGLNSLGVNIARSIGPAAGGVLLASIGAAFTYGADVSSDLLVAAALLWWRRSKKADNALPEHFLGAFRAGIRYTRASRELHRVLLRAAVFFLFVSCVWALLPLIARDVLHGGASFYGVLLGAVGAGAIGGAVLLPRVRQRLTADHLLLAASVISALAMLVLALGPPKWVAIVALLGLGGAWITALTTLNGVAQSILPNWVRGRGLAVYLTVFNGAMAAGSLGWGALAQSIGVTSALWIGAAAVVVAALATYALTLPASEVDLTSSNQWPEPLLIDPVANDRGPVLIQVEYTIAREDLTAFVAALVRLSDERRRDGAYAWGLTQDTADPEHVVEWFMVESWAEHLRQHHRFSNAGADLQREATRFHKGDAPKVTHLLAIDRTQAAFQPS
ncbi:putative MFS family arabinose efflux permease [Luteibacter rhizovicinus]|uniref:Putative MFS family arabinose efflux permease n=1 Tax=Luteibacter rhizovicinus TaxID=242606 RepID=A0A4R3YLG8_9GAMM|nr:MFS transporter [Luteibacter rhizovicinus]TCV93427.1 putative MFS family arabinose efflux permease [Luteibacter rhizovicinus]